MCCKYPKLIRAESVTVATGVTTFTLPATAEFEAGDVLDILVASPIPEGTNGSTVTITNGTVSGDLLNGYGNYFRPRPILSRTIFRVQYFSDPEHFQFLAIKR